MYRDSKISHYVAAAFVVVFSLVLASCGGGGGGGSSTTSPTISGFTADVTTISAGTSVNLTAVFADGTGTVDNGVGSITSNTPASVSPTTTTTYTLTVTDSAGVAVTSTVTVTVVALPTITSFSTDSATISAGASANLTAVFDGGTGTIDSSVGVVTSGTAVSVTPAMTTTYTLTVTNAAGDAVTSTVTVTVSALPGITSFSADATIISAGSSVNVTAVFANGSGSIDNGVGAVTSGTPVSITPTATTTYTLTVTNTAGAVTSTVTVNVVALPSITSFTAGATTIPAGTSVNLTAVFTGGVGNMDNGIGSVISGTIISVTPTSTTTYTLTITNAAGDNVASTVTVNVLGLDTLSVAGGTLDQLFQPNQLSYTATVGFVTASAIVTATTSNAGATITVNGIAIGTDNTSQSIALVDGLNPAITIVVTASDATTITYTLTITRQLAAAFAQQAYIKASSSDAFVNTRKFGYSVALSGDTLAVGAPNEDSSATGINGDETTDFTNGTESGAVYVFTRSGSTWLQQAYIKASNTGKGDQFGASVALSGDTLVVGAAWEDSAATGVNGDQSDNSAFQSGAVYVFTRSGSTWSQQAYIKASNPDGGGDAISTGDLFGESVALSGDTLVVGASREDSVATGVSGDQTDNSASDAGAVYVFTRSGVTWSQQAYIKASNTTAYGLFGERVTVSGNTLAAGARGLGAGAGSGTYVFTRSGTTWSQQAYLTASRGDSVSLSGDTLAVGTKAASGLVTVSGAVYVYTRNGTAWSQQAFLEASNADILDNFGDNVALSGDTLVVGAYGESSNAVGVNGDQTDNSANSSGAAYVFTRNGTAWSQQAYLKASNAEALDFFSGSGFNSNNVAVSGGTIAIGAWAEDSAATGVNGDQADNSAQWAGAVYVFE